MENEKPEEKYASGKMISLSEAAKIIGVSYTTVFRLAQCGELKALRVRNNWRTSTTACQEYLERGFREQAIICQSVEME